MPASAAEEDGQLQSGAETASGLLVTPEGKGPFPAVIVIQEWWGLNDWVKDQARALAKEGYVALAVDLYRGKVTAKQEEAHQLMMGLPPERAMRDLKAAFALPARRAPDVKKDRIGSIGWCMGGTLLAGARDRGADAGRGGRLLRRAAHRRGGHREDQGAGARQLRRRRQGPVARAGEGVRGRDEEGGQERRHQDLRGRAATPSPTPTTPGAATARPRPRTPGPASIAFLAKNLKK